MKPDQLQILISSGPESAERAVLGFSLAAAAASAGTQVLVHLTMNGARWALKSEGNQPSVPGFQPVSELISVIQAVGGTIQVCSHCASESGCDNSRPFQPQQMRPGITPGGLVALAARIGQTPTLTF